MNSKNIFKMEFYRNFRDKTWLIIIGVLTILSLIDSVLIISLINQTVSNSSEPGRGPSVLIALTVFFTLALVVGIWAFQIIYPFHLLSVDYSNKALSLMIASGVNRMTYYFIKLVATLLSTLLAFFTMFIIPFILILGVYSHQLSEFLSMISDTFSIGNILMLILNSLVGSLASIVILFFVVIMTRGKFWGIFVYLGITMAIGIIVVIFTSSIAAYSSNSLNTMPNTSWFGLLLSLIEGLIFGLIGLSFIKKQDL